MKILVASSNNSKIKEFKEILKTFNYDILCLNDFDYIEEPEEIGKTFEENSTIKAEYYGKKLNISTISDDSGICIKSLNNGPGIYSKRYAQDNGGFPGVFDFIKKKFENDNVKDYSAVFVCNVSFYDIGFNKTYNFEGICNGKIVFPARGINGFGYDPIFMPNCEDKTMAELTSEEKNTISHRFFAIEKFINFLKNK